MDDRKSMNLIADKSKSNKQPIENNNTHQQDDEEYLVKVEEEESYDDWEDADFQDLDLRPASRGVDAKLKRESESNVNEEEDDNDDWLSTATPVKSPYGMKKPADGIYLTNQFINLNTPASKKKRRCIECTKPVNDEVQLLCPKCSLSASNKK